MVEVTFLGGAREIGRSCIFISKSDYSILLDCGVAIGATNKEDQFPLSPPTRPNALFVSHAHLDHCGYVPKVIRDFDIPYYATPPTQDLGELLLLDNLRIQRQNGGTPLYNVKDVNYLRKKSVDVRYRVPMTLTSTNQSIFFSAGHTLGSAMIWIKMGTKRILYTGDFSMHNSRTHLMADMNLPKIDTVIMESTYCGTDDKRPSRQVIEQELIQAINETYDIGGKTIIAVFAIGRAQQILLTLDAYMNSQGLHKMPIYIDGLIRKVNEKYKLYWEWLRPEIQKQIRYTRYSPFDSKNFILVKRRDNPIFLEEPCIIVSTSGMLQGGPILNYITHLGEKPSNLIVLTGYQVEGSRGRQLLNGHRSLKIGDDIVNIRAKVKNFEFSGHADVIGLFRFISSLKGVRNIILVHGESEKMDSFAERIESKKKKITVYVPSVGETIRL